MKNKPPNIKKKLCANKKRKKEILSGKNFFSLFYDEKVCLEMHLFKTKHINISFVNTQRYERLHMTL